jgi:hypothetical protein
MSIFILISFKSKYSYYEKIMLLYYLVISNDSEYIGLINQFEILTGIKKENLFYEEGHGLI